MTQDRETLMLAQNSSNFFKRGESHDSVIFNAQPGWTQTWTPLNVERLAFGDSLLFVLRCFHLLHDLYDSRAALDRVIETKNQVRRVFHRDVTSKFRL